jgi:hypothetical protein
MFLAVRKEVVAPGVSEFQSEHLIISVKCPSYEEQNYLEKQDSFCKLVSKFEDQLLLQFVEKCNVVYKQNSIFV